MKRAFYLYAWLIMAIGILMLGGCATTAPKTTLVPIPVPCKAAQEIPEEPARNLTLDATKPGEAVKAYTANRSRWIGYADALRIKLEDCK
jgi:uncharacterized lipoprotein YajG